jgi:single-strand DNA-binding protein
MNNITIAGQLGKDCESRFLPNGDAVTSFSVADSQGRDKPTIWWNCSIFGKRGEALAQYLTKGQSVTVGGSITEREWTDKDGNKRKSMDIRVADVALQGGKRDASGTEGYQGGTGQRDAAAPAPKGYQGTRPSSKPAPNFSDMDDDIPF